MDDGRISHHLQITTRPTDRLLLFESILDQAHERGARVVATAPGTDEPRYRRCIEESGIPDRRVLFSPIEAIVADAQSIEHACESLRAAVDKITSSSNTARRTKTLFFFDLDQLMQRASSAREAMTVFASCFHLGRTNTSDVWESASLRLLPRGLGADFWSFHTSWIVSRRQLDRRLESLGDSVQRLFLEEPGFRRELLTEWRSTGDVDQALDGLIPAALGSYRRGFLFIDASYTIRHVSDRAATLLRRANDKLEGEPLSTCLDGIDLATLKREISKTDDGDTVSPFITSWRLAPGVYEPREVTIDRVRVANRTLGYLLSITISEEVRGPRTVYKQIRQDASLSDLSDGDSADALPEIIDELESTQLTRREHEVLLLIISGMSNRAISTELTIAEVTVKKHLTSVYRKLRVSNRRELFQSFRVPGEPHAEEEL
ncbi:MAG: LuxR C-terminal-related transcriptional regulator [Spirochaetales bacterium]